MKKLLVDTGPLVAILSSRDPAHQRCVDVLRTDWRSLVTTWAVIAEAMFLVRASARAQGSLLGMIGTRRLEITDLLGDIDRIAVLIEKYRDVPMDFADATLVAVAEREDLETIFTLDEDFRIYRSGGRGMFTLVP
jgi:uncharacterized protein